MTCIVLIILLSLAAVIVVAEQGTGSSNSNENDDYPYLCERPRDLPLSDSIDENLAMDGTTGKFYFLKDYIDTHPDADLNSLDFMKGGRACVRHRGIALMVHIARGEISLMIWKELDPWPWETVEGECFIAESTFRTFALSVWPIIWIWYLILILFMFFTDLGIGDFIIFRAVIPVMTCWLSDENHITRHIKRSLRRNRRLERIVESRLLQFREERNRRRRTSIERMQIEVAEGFIPQGSQSLQASDIISGDVQVTLMLKTKFYQANGTSYNMADSDNDDDDSAGNHTCSICLVELEKGKGLVIFHATTYFICHA
eukprot:CAMPEP_0116047496 /NCGR_PEP_ID=MMETSP0321-20121206/28931_1 /TAXON_ID=163516 /ORGANISM="Leptocylindrus danicus var. danicus, Strain B650" /LENGTH=314 /DNA_ID=CAMNT_0003529397 /DNA_START=81 /DNA_END=1027 /DNA_ORIENTATION=+